MGKFNDFMKRNKSRLIIYPSLLVLIASSVIGTYFYVDYLTEKISGSQDIIKRSVKVQGDQLKKCSSCDELDEFFEKSREVSYNQLEELATSAPQDAPGKGGGSDDYSETNVQVKGVDEADIVKTDGEYIYTVAKENNQQEGYWSQSFLNNKIKIVKAYPADEASVVSTIDFPQGTSAQELFIGNNKLMAMGTKKVEQDPIDEGLPDWYKDNLYKTYSFMKVWDLSDKSNPMLVRNVEFEGTYTTSRKIKDSVYIVINTIPEYGLIDENINASGIIPTYSETNSRGSHHNYVPAATCVDIEYFDNIKKQKDAKNSEDDYIYPGSGNAFVSVLTISMADDGKFVDKRIIVGNSEDAYASLESLYLTSRDYSYSQDGYSVEKTGIHKFKLSSDKTDYLGSGEVSGRVLNQFSMDENNGYFRVATTKGNSWDETNKSSNNVYILDSSLKVVGKIENLAPGERIYSARFTGDRGYLVTFKKVDPFFTLDLKDPNNPKVLGQLKIPGYSNYLHPYDDTHIIGLGKNTKEAAEELKNERDIDFAWYQGIKMAIFDVSDFQNPKEMHKVDIGDRGTDSYALNDHKAFLFDKEKNLLVIPILLAELSEEQRNGSEPEDWTYGEYTYQGAYVYNITLDKGFELKGKISHYPNGKPENTEGYYYYNDTLSIERTLFIEDKLYTVSQGKILINNLSDLAKIKEISLN